MNILYHHRTQGQGAEGVHIREVAHALMALGHPVEMLSPPGVDPFQPGGAGTAPARSSGIRKGLGFLARFMPQICFEGLELAYNLYSQKLMRAALARHKPGLVYERYAFFCFAPSRISRAAGIPHILEVNEISGIKRQRPQTLVGLCNRYELEVFHNVAAIVVVSDFLKSQIVARGINPNKIHVIPNGINPADFTGTVAANNLRDRLRLAGKTVIVFVGMFSQWDSLDMLLRVFARIREAHARLHLVLVGDGVQKAGLISLAASLGLGDAVTFTGRVPRDMVPRYIALADICVLSGSNPFGSPIALFEYMAMGKPVVVPEYGPITAIVRHGQEGLVFAPYGEEMMAACLEKLLGNSALRETMGRAARARIADNFTWSNNARKVLDICRALPGRD